MQYKRRSKSRPATTDIYAKTGGTETLETAMIDNDDWSIGRLYCVYAEKLVLNATISSLYSC